MGVILAPALSALRAIPPWVWVVVVSLLWGGYQHRRATAAGEQLRQAQAQAAAEEAKALRASIAESERRAAAHQEIASAAQARIDALERSAAAARAVAGRVRPAAVAFAASAAASNPAATAECKATEAAAHVLADLLGRTVDRAAGLAHLADASRSAGQACEAAYQALTR